jgi:hypothetical protein
MTSSEEIAQLRIEVPKLRRIIEEMIENTRVILMFTANEAKNSKSAALAHDLLSGFRHSGHFFLSKA